MKDNIEIHFSGLARNCSSVIEENLNNILDICNNTSESISCNIWIAENDSDDKTREILKRYEDRDIIHLILFDRLDEKFPDRVTRLAYLREYLFIEIKNKITNVDDADTTYLYVPIDLDSNITKSINKDDFIRECNRVNNKEINAIFPISEPYYYDIFALRSEGWVEEDPFTKVREDRNKYGTFLSKYIHIYSKQKSARKLKSEGRKKVQSAFGGVGIYDMAEILDNSYKKQDDKQEVFPVKTCEHVIFNQKMDLKEISPEFVVQAPDEHISFNTSLIAKIKILALSIAVDLKRSIL